VSYIFLQVTPSIKIYGQEADRKNVKARRTDLNPKSFARKVVAKRIAQPTSKMGRHTIMLKPHALTNI
jgi:hypothetical protein